MNAKHGATGRCVFLAVALLALGRPVRAEDIRFPVDPGVADVTKAPYRADNTGAADASDAILAATRDMMGTQGFVYFPNGTYKISKPLEWKGKNTWPANPKGWWGRMSFRGQSRDGVVLRLIDNAPGFGDPKKPLGMIVTASEQPFRDGGNNQGFNNSIRNLTVETGKGNPGAVGIDYVVSNQGAITDVRIVSGDGAGYAGIGMERSWPGPGLIKNVEVVGFDYGVRWVPMDYSMTLENITLTGQRKAGIYNKTAQAHIRGLKSTNAVPALVSPDGFNLLLDAELTGGSPDQPAIISRDTLLRDVTVRGYGKVLQDPSKAGRDVPMTGQPTTVAEYASAAPRSLFPSPGKTLRLPVEATPDAPADGDPATWANVLDYGANPDGKTECGAAVQKAPDSGKATVWFPGKSRFVVARTLTVPATVKHIHSAHATVAGRGGAFADKAKPRAIWRVAEDSPDPLVIEHLETVGDDGAIALDQACRRTVAWKHGSIGGGWGDGDTPCYVNTATGGKFFVEDCMGSRYRVQGPQQVWARQLNTEYGRSPMLTARGAGARVWVLGWKTENSSGKQSLLHLSDGAEVEAFGPFAYMLAGSKETPLFTNDGGLLSLSFRQGGQKAYAVSVRETRGGTTKELRDVHGNVVLYTGYADDKAGPAGTQNPSPKPPPKSS